MKKEVAMEWVKALRSGKYKQGKGRLSLYGEFCCLGVLCEIVPEGTVVKKASFPGTIYDGDAEYLPESVQRYSGIRSCNGRFMAHPSAVTPYASLTQVNDCYGSSFDKVADVIEQNWELL